jgi:hypothetical protein
MNTLEVEVIQLVTDNLNTRSEKSFYETFDKNEAERILSKLEFIIHQNMQACKLAQCRRKSKST